MSGRTTPLFKIILIFIVLGALPLLYIGCDYARMKDQESVRTYEKEMPSGVEGTVPVNGGIEILKRSDPDKLLNPVASTNESLQRGKTAYGYFCIMCHGPKLDGSGTVGQSFAPLPTDLKGRAVREESDGLLFYRISLGYKRHPPLADTVSEEDRWAIINYVRTAQKEPS